MVLLAGEGAIKLGEEITTKALMTSILARKNLPKSGNDELARNNNFQRQVRLATILGTQ